MTNDGAVVYAPAIKPLPGDVGYPYWTFSEPNANVGLAVTHDSGATWTATVPTISAGVPDAFLSGQDHRLFVDRGTGRLFWFNPSYFSGAGNSSVSYTDDDGSSWRYASVPFAAAENPQFVAARAPANQPTPHGYRNVLYLCEDTSVLGGAASAAGGRLCIKSLDGGATWIVTGQGLLGAKPLPAHTECNGNGESFGPDGQVTYPVALPDGALVAIVSCDSHNYLARSDDEGHSWPIVGPAPADGALRADDAGHLYVLTPADTSTLQGGVPTQLARRLLLRTSADAGRSWSPPMDVVAPGLGAVATWEVAARGDGIVAVSYLAPAEGSSTYNGYISQTFDALSSRPVFWAASLNDPSRPLLWQPRGSQPLTFLDFIGLDIGPDGTAWASFVQDCGPSPSAPSCTSRFPSTTSDPYIGFAGHLARPAVAAGATKPSRPAGKTTTKPDVVRRPRSSLAATGQSPAVPGIAAAAVMAALVTIVSRRRGTRSSVTRRSKG